MIWFLLAVSPLMYPEDEDDFSVIETQEIIFEDDLEETASLEEDLDE